MNAKALGERQVSSSHPLMPGMTLRQYYAGLAMASIPLESALTSEYRAMKAVKHADALLAELVKEQP